jgi:ABC-type uncharacterized transport system substrate-binding protein
MTGGDENGRLRSVRSSARRHYGLFALAVIWGWACLLMAPSPVQAHPHVWVTMESTILYGPDGNVTGVRHAWSFDDMFSAFAIQGIPAKKKGAFTREELAPLAEVNVTSLQEYKYFTFAKVNGRRVPFTDPIDYWLEHANGILILHFTLPLKAPVNAKTLDIEIYDPSFFVYFEFAKSNPVKLTAGPAGCKLQVDRPKELDVSQTKNLTEEFFAALTASSAWAAQFMNKIALRCP